jgi:hypothetical protein
LCARENPSCLRRDYGYPSSVKGEVVAPHRHHKLVRTRKARRSEAFGRETKSMNDVRAKGLNRRRDFAYKSTRSPR